MPRYSDDTSITYGLPGSAVIFDKKGDTYYALTAKHCFVSSGEDYWFVLNYKEPTVNSLGLEGLHKLGKTRTQYYNQFPRQKIEYKDKVADIAIISFKSKGNLHHSLYQIESKREDRLS